MRSLLTAAGVAFEDTPTLVRGLDYYTRTTFEFVHDGLGAQAAVGGGGRYDGLSESIGGPQLPGVGWALGVDRTVLALRAEGIEPTACRRCRGLRGADRRRGGGAAVRRGDQVRRAGVRADLAYGGRGLKGAMKSADRSGARYAVVLGERDLAAGVAQVKDLGTGDQTAVPLDDVVTDVVTRLQEPSS